MGRSMALFLSVVLLCMICGTAGGTGANKPVTIGVLAHRGTQDTLDHWTATAEYLSSKIPGMSFQIVPLSFQEINAAVECGEVEFIAANPSIYVELEALYRVSRLATMKCAGPGGVSTTELGGVIFALSDRSDIKSLGDLRGKSLMAVDETSLGGWMACLRELKKKGIVPHRFFSRLVFGGTHDEVVEAVKNRTVDAGTVRTGILEDMQEQGKIDLNAFRILNPYKHDNFPLAASTALYPEWPFAKLSHTSSQLAEQVSIALLSMPRDAPAAIALRINGWTIPMDYQSVHEMLKDLHLGIYEDFGKISIREALRQHSITLFLFLTLIAVMGITTVFVGRANGRLKASRMQLAQAHEVLETRVRERTGDLTEVNLLLLQEIEERKKTETQLNQWKQDWEDTFNTITDMITIHDKDFNIIRANTAAANVLGFSGFIPTNAKCYKYYHGENSVPQNCPGHESLVNGKPSIDEIFEASLQMFLEIRAMPRLDGQGNIAGLIHICRDITDRKRMEESVEEQKRFAEILIEGSAVATFVLGPDHRVISWNKACENLTGVYAADVIGTDNHWKPFYAHKRPCLADFVIDGKSDELSHYYQVCSCSTLAPEGLHAEGWYRNLGGKDRYIFFAATPIRNSKGELVAAIETLQDITERKSAEEALRESEQRYRLLFKTSPIGIFHYDANLRITALNERFAAILRTSADKLEWFDMNMLKDKRVLPAIQQALDGKPGFYEGMYTSTLSPCDIWISLHTAPIIESGGEINGAIAIVEDKTDRHKLEEHLRHSQKIEAIGQLAGGVAHDFNNILSAIVGYADLALMKLSKDDALRGNIEQILRASGRAAALTRGLLSFSRRQVIIPGTLDLNEIVKKQENFLARLIREDIDIRTTYAKCPLPIFADSGQLEAVLMNLVTNARDAMPKGGVIEIRTERATLGEDFIAAHGGGTAGRYAGVIVSDTGEGIDESIISKIFDPFFTTKEQGQGTGLGLSMVYGTVRQHNGYIDVSSERGIGSTFKVYLPLYKTAHKEVSGQAEPDALPRGSETILIAEDDAPLRDLFSTVLENHGYRVIVATDGDEAIIKYNENQDAVKLIILDGIMPKKSGIRAYREIRIINPSVKVLFVSGYAEEIINKEGLLDLDINLLRKPFTPGVLLTRIRELLDGGVCG